MSQLLKRPGSYRAEHTVGVMKKLGYAYTHQIIRNGAKPRRMKSQEGEGNMRFHISEIEMSVNVAGWGKTIELTGETIAELQSLDVGISGSKSIDVDFDVNVAGVVYKATLPVTVMVFSQETVAMEIPEAIEIIHEEEKLVMFITGKTFGYINLRPLYSNIRTMPSDLVHR